MISPCLLREVYATDSFVEYRVCQYPSYIIYYYLVIDLHIQRISCNIGKVGKVTYIEYIYFIF